MPLFLRRPRQVVLTEAGQRLAPAVTEAFALMSEAYAAVRAGAEGTLVISTVQTFGSNWLARHLGSFQIAHPSIAVRLDTSSHMVDFAREDIDVGIRSGGGNWPGLAAHMLFRADFTPMLSPQLAASIGGVKEPADLLRLPHPRSERSLVDAVVRRRRRAGRRTCQAPRQQHGLAGLRGQRGDGRAGRGDPDAGAVRRRACRRPPDPALRPRRRRRPRLLAGLSRSAPQRAQDPRLPRLAARRDRAVGRRQRSSRASMRRRQSALHRFRPPSQRRRRASPAARCCAAASNSA